MKEWLTMALVNEGSNLYVALGREAPSLDGQPSAWQYRYAFDGARVYDIFDMYRAVPASLTPVVDMCVRRRLPYHAAGPAFGSKEDRFTYGFMGLRPVKLEILSCVEDPNAHERN